MGDWVGRGLRKDFTQHPKENREESAYKGANEKGVLCGGLWRLICECGRNGDHPEFQNRDRTDQISTGTGKPGLGEAQLCGSFLRPRQWLQVETRSWGEKAQDYFKKTRVRTFC